MEELVERCAGLDVHQAEITACARTPGEHGGVVETVQEFGTTTPDLLATLDWLKALRLWSSTRPFPSNLPIPRSTFSVA